MNSTYVVLEIALWQEAVLCSVYDSNSLTCTQTVSGTSKTTDIKVIIVLRTMKSSHLMDLGHHFLLNRGDRFIRRQISHCEECPWWSTKHLAAQSALLDAWIVFSP
jgi:hypothetical protein